MFSLYYIAALFALAAAAAAVYRWRTHRARGELFTAVGMILLAGSMLIRGLYGAGSVQTIILVSGVIVILYGAYLRSKRARPVNTP